MAKVKNQTLGFIREVSIVVIGVLIAVSIGNYKEKVDNQNYLQKTLLAVENEIEYSQKDLDTVIPRHYQVMETIEANLENEELTLAELLKEAGGLQVASIKIISLRFFVANKADVLDFELISQLQEIEWITELISNKLNKIIDFLYSNLTQTNQEAKIKLAYLISDLIESEESLLELYENFKKKNQAFLQQ
jgi:hypothetical protein